MVGWCASPYGVTWWLDPDPPTKVHSSIRYISRYAKQATSLYISEVK